jgi:hypothetical protein
MIPDDVRRLIFFTENACDSDYGRQGSAVTWITPVGQLELYASSDKQRHLSPEISP